jgi:hypothetical protein
MGTSVKRSANRLYRTTFTYFIPSPPSRKNGYREVELDKIMRGILDSGFELESFSTEGTSTGVFFFATLSTKSKKVYESDLKQDIHEHFKLSHSHSSPDIIIDEEEDA